MLQRYAPQTAEQLGGPCIPFWVHTDGHTLSSLSTSSAYPCCAPVARTTACRLQALARLQTRSCCLFRTPRLHAQLLDTHARPDRSCVLQLEEVYSEIRRVLKPGGLFASYEWVATKDFDPDNAEHVRIIDEINFGNGLPVRILQLPAGMKKKDIITSVPASLAD